MSLEGTGCVASKCGTVNVVFLNAMVILHTWDVLMCILQPDETYYMVSIFFSNLLLKKTETIQQN